MTKFKIGDKVRVKLAGGKGVGETLWEIVRIVPGRNQTACYIREAGTNHASQRFDTSLLVIEPPSDLRLLVAKFLATYWEEGDGHPPPAFIREAEEAVKDLTPEELAKAQVRRHFRTTEEVEGISPIYYRLAVYTKN